MRSFIVVIFCFTLISGFACASELKGTWVQDNKALLDTFGSRLTAEEREMTDCMSQNMLFNEKNLMIWQDKMTCVISGERTVVHPFKYKYNYNILANQNDMMVIELKDEGSGDRDLQVYYFVNENLFWVYFYGRDPSDSEHMRVYYRRAK